MKKQRLVVWEKYYWVSGIYIEDCYVVENSKFLIIDIEWEWNLLDPNEKYIFKHKKEAKTYILKDLQKQIENVSLYEEEND